MFPIALKRIMGYDAEKLGKRVKMGWIYFLIWFIGYWFAVIEMIRAEIAHTKKWGEGYEGLVLTSIPLYVLLALGSWFAWVVAFSMRKDFE